MLTTDLTVLAVVENDGKFLMIEEPAGGRRVLTQPGGHIEAGETPEDAVIRETLEETGCDVAVSALLGVYLWIHPQTRQQFLKIAYAADLLLHDDSRDLDECILAVQWLTPSNVRRLGRNHRNPVVMRCLEDYLAGRRQPDSLFAGMLPLQQNVHAVLANAALV